MRQLPDRWLQAARSWADAPPRRSADEAAARARATAPATAPAGLPGGARLAVAAATLAVAAVAGGSLAWRAASAPSRGVDATAAPIAGPAPTRTVVLRLASGTPLYVTLPPAPAPEGRPRS